MRAVVKKAVAAPSLPSPFPIVRQSWKSWGQSSPDTWSRMLPLIWRSLSSQKGQVALDRPRFWWYLVGNLINHRSTGKLTFSLQLKSFQEKNLTTSTSLLDFPEILPIVLFILQLAVPWRQGYLHRLDDRVDSMDEAGTEKSLDTENRKGKLLTRCWEIPLNECSLGRIIVQYLRVLLFRRFVMFCGPDNSCIFASMVLSSLSHFWLRGCKLGLISVTSGITW